MKQNINAYLVMAAMVALLGGVALGYVVGFDNGWERALPVSSFEECAAAGNPVMESYPRQCRSADGMLFIERIPVPATPPVAGGGCMKAGCSGTICADAKEAAGIVTTCEYRPEYACYRGATCERQASGKCGWTQTQALKTCLNDPRTEE